MLSLFFVIVFCLVFAYTNGSNDSANAISILISTHAISPRMAIVYGAFMNLCGAFLSLKIAETISGNLFDAETLNTTAILGAILGAIFWNFSTWYFALPSSTSYSLIGSLVGATIAKSGWSSLHLAGIGKYVFLPMIIAPVAGSLVSFSFFSILLLGLRSFSPVVVSKLFFRFQLLSSGAIAFSHGANDIPKIVAIIGLSLMVKNGNYDFSVSHWFVFLCALAMGVGCIFGGIRTVRVMGTKIVKMRSLEGFCAEISAASLIISSSLLGIPVSTSHIVSGSIIGVGCRKRINGVRWQVFGRIVSAWILTIPMAGLFGALFYLIFSFFQSN